MSNSIFKNTRYNTLMNGGGGDGKALQTNLDELQQSIVGKRSYKECYENIKNSLKELNDYYYKSIEFTDIESIRETYDITTIENKELKYKTIMPANKNNPAYYMINNTTIDLFKDEINKYATKYRDKFVIFNNVDDTSIVQSDNLIILNITNLNVYEAYAKIESFPSNLLNTFSYIFYPGLFTSSMFDNNKLELILLVSRLIYIMFKGLNTKEGDAMLREDINTMWSKCGLSSSIIGSYDNSKFFKRTGSKFLSYTTADYNTWEGKLRSGDDTLDKILDRISR